MANAEQNGRESLQISARELYARVGPLPGRNYRMLNCCRVMKAQLAPDYGDVIVNEPRSGQGPTLTIRYRLPRQKRVGLWPPSQRTGCRIRSLTVVPKSAAGTKLIPEVKHLLEVGR
jgi:hypothetical protein